MVLGKDVPADIARGWQEFEQIKLEQLQGKRAPQGYDLGLFKSASSKRRSNE